MSASGTNAASPARLDRHATIDRAAGYLALAGATLGIIAGLVDIAVGASIRDWVGNKLHTTTLGAATLILSATALLAAVRWLRPGGGRSERRLATVLALLLVGVVCFTTIGRLWILPGVLLLVAGALIFATSSRHELTDAVDEHRWRIGLTADLAMLPMEPGSPVTERKMLHGIRQRAERLASQPRESMASARPARVLR